MEIFRPQEYLDSIYNIDYDELLKKGKRCILMDLDDTLLPREMLHITPVLFTFIERIKEKGFKVFLLSNSLNPERVKHVAHTFNIPYSTLSAKPLPFAFRRAMSELKVAENECVIIGDQLFMDILGGNLLGIYTILVKPMSEERSFIRYLMRVCEKLVLRRLKLEP